ncbi:BatD family protein [Dyella amyloliquefaciens]|uniref:BatD family protein n=1 Tax=Dyella amyloliquefaciens TaxID=1770545 RepID=UPI0013EEDFF7|nr:BatD family protein [Dyella amyloliquefaciens]
MKAWLACALLLLAAAAWADEPVPPPPRMQVRVHQEPAGALVEGETARIVVDMLTPDFFTDAPVLPVPHVEGVYVALSDETPGHLVDTIDGATWSGVSRTYLVTPLISGKVEIPSFDVVAHIGPQATAVTVQTTPLILTVQALVLPKGVTEALIASSVKITQTVLPQDSGLHVGDSVTRRVEITAEGAPAMMLPPVNFAPINGLELYASPPATRDVIGNQGGFVGGSRVDSASYVIQKRGRYTLPPITVRWLDSRTRTWRVSEAPAVRFHAWWGTPTRPRFALPGQGVMPRLIGFLTSDLGIAILLLAVLAWFAWIFRVRLQRWRDGYKAWRYRRWHSEAAAFATLRRQRHTTSAVTLHGAADAWARRSAEDGAPASVEGWCKRYGDAALTSQWTALDTSLYGAASAPWSAQALIEGLTAARKRWKHERRQRRRRVVLPPLNPA